MGSRPNLLLADGWSDRMRFPGIVLGIDPGRDGAIVAISRRLKTVRAWDMPQHGHLRGNDLSALRDIFRHFVPTDCAVGLEYNTGKPHEVPDFAYRFGLQTGQIEGLLLGMGFDVTCVPANLWTGRLGLPGKTWATAIEQRAAMWDQEYPASASLMRGPRGGLRDGRLDAGLIAHYLLITTGPFGRLTGKNPPKVFG
jgi:hypothetical protein